MTERVNVFGILEDVFGDAIGVRLTKRFEAAIASVLRSDIAGTSEEYRRGWFAGRDEALAHLRALLFAEPVQQKENPEPSSLSPTPQPETDK